MPVTKLTSMDQGSTSPATASSARDAFAAWIPNPKERNDMVEVAAYHIAQRSGFKLDPQKCWDEGQAQVDLMLSLRESQLKLQTILDNAFDAMVMIDAEGAITSWNPHATKIFGWTHDEAIGQTIHAMIVPLSHRDAHVQGMKHFLASGEGPFLNSLIEVQALRRDGREFPIELTIAPVRSAGKLEFSAFIRDITERKRAEGELKRSNAELEQFSYAVSHDMRQPLRMIASYLQLLDKELGNKLDAEQREYLNFAVDGAKRLDQMLVGLLEYSRVGRKGEAPESIDSRALLDEALRFLEPASTEEQAEMRIEGTWPQISANPNEILRLLQNLIGNALKFRIAGRKPAIVVSSEKRDKEWRVSVCDNGIGIVPEQIGRLFQVFQRLQLRADYEGSGIGLALCRKIVEHHGGRIWAESAGQGQGSRFCFALPQQGCEKLAARVQLPDEAIEAIVGAHEPR